MTTLPVIASKPPVIASETKQSGVNALPVALYGATRIALYGISIPVFLSVDKRNNRGMIVL
ncbi:MAG: hypothetical protein LBT00_06390 [Spirochaetaceae bacterium]|jgi:hypothetical protein|nr:hypothetical protein [Spirochaetaceae bacterium]